jgi:hypothetical protein
MHIDSTSPAPDQSETIEQVYNRVLDQLIEIGNRHDVWRGCAVGVDFRTGGTAITLFVAADERSEPVQQLLQEVVDTVDLAGYPVVALNTGDIVAQ